MVFLFGAGDKGVMHNGRRDSRADNSILPSLLFFGGAVASVANSSFSSIFFAFERKKAGKGKMSVS